ncbi:NAD(P)H-binding protein [Streptomyces sp. SID14478]|uniref:NAD(P)H-binding protein n=1 Tax=Streptomyces sp. SID14478 TaxID=2706073 RepID=UPI0013DD4A22|nr:NAD(P)H-binding protein [Streptomyces sp. SID14478]NEB77131.1 NAD(P)H-binding protein [Streptomyces sp. SID14478]
MILVTGATGTVGREVVRRLPAGLRVRLMTRDPAKVVAPGEETQVVAADYEDPRSLECALQGVSAALVITNRVGGDDDLRLFRAAQAVGVRRLVKLSAAAVLDPDAVDLITRWQRTTEELLLASGIEWTLLRPRAFMSNTLSWAGSIRSDRVVRAQYGASANACVDPRDIAEVAVRALTEEGHAGKAYTLTGPEPITPAEQTEQLAQVLGVPLRFEELSLEQARAGLLERYPEPIAEALLGSARRQEAGAKAAVDGTMCSLTGRAALTFRDWARGNRTAFT